MGHYSVSFVLPMYNEEKAIADTLEEVRIIAKAIADDYEIVVSDDASTDNSCSIVERISEVDRRVRLVRVLRNTKFGGALANGIRSAKKDIIIYTDSDLPVSLFDIKKSLPLLESAEIVTAVSTLKKHNSLKRKIISFGYNSLLKILFGIAIRDVNSGYKIFKRDVVGGMEFMSESPFIDAEIFIKAKAMGARIAEFPIVFRSRRQGESKVARLSVITRTFRDMFRFRFFKK